MGISFYGSVPDYGRVSHWEFRKLNLEAFRFIRHPF
jgi:hypothetical protein